MEMERVRSYKNKNTGLSYSLFGEDQKRISLYCSDDDTGASDITIDLEELNKNYELIEEYFDEA